MKKLFISLYICREAYEECLFSALVSIDSIEVLVISYLFEGKSNILGGGYVLHKLEDGN